MGNRSLNFPVLQKVETHIKLTVYAPYEKLASDYNGNRVLSTVSVQGIMMTDKVAGQMLTYLSFEDLQHEADTRPHASVVLIWLYK